MEFDHPDSFESRVLNSLDTLSGEVQGLKIAMAQLPHQYVPRTEIVEARRLAQAAYRWAIGLGVSTLLGVIGLFFVA